MSWRTVIEAMAREAHVAVNGRLITSSPADELLARLEEPQVVSALNDLLDHAGLLAFLVTGLDGFFGRGDVIADSLADGINELRGAAAAPGLAALLGTLGDPRTAETLAQLATALVEGRANAIGQPGPSGVFGLLRALKDDDVARGLGFLIQVAKSLGKQLDSP